MASDWQTLFDFLPSIPRDFVGINPPLPSGISGPQITLVLSAFSRGGQSASQTSIQGPIFPEDIDGLDRAVLFTFYTLGQRIAQKEIFPSASASFSSQPPSQPSVPRLSPPDPYSGGKEKFRFFATQLQLVFSSDPFRFSADSAKIAYSASFLRDSALSWFSPHLDLSTGLSDFITYSEFFSALQATFNDPDALDTAERNL
jgi:hypothetical protein